MSRWRRQGQLTSVLVVSALLLLAAKSARAEDVHRDAQRMTREMRTYFAGELEQAAVFAGIGAGSGYFGGVLLAHGTDASRAAAVPVLIAGALELVAGLGLMIRTGAQVDERRAQLGAAPGRFKAEEIERMQGVAGRFTIALGIEGTALVAGVVTASAGAALEEDRAVGAGLGLAVQATTLLVLDLLAEARAERYIEQLQRFHIGPLVSPAGVSAAAPGFVATYCF
jgi:hypothetical protein